jgi:solute carrier family 25, member 34/35
MYGTGLYEPFRHFNNSIFGYGDTDQIPLLSVLAGATSGAVGGELECAGKCVMCAQLNNRNPWQPIIFGQGPNAGSSGLRARLTSIHLPRQAYSPALPVGTQHDYKSIFSAISLICRKEGFHGLCRGVDAAILRTAMGSSVRLLNFD